MKKLNHRQKQRLARQHKTHSETIATPRVDIFQTEFWEDRKKKIRQRVKQTIKNRKNAKNNKKVA